MPTIRIGAPRDKSQQKISIVQASASSLDVSIGGSREEARQEVSITESQANELRVHLDRLQVELIALKSSEALNSLAPAFANEVTALAQQAERVVKERRWYSVSTGGLLQAAKAVGETAVPLLAAAMKVVEIVGSLK